MNDLRYTVLSKNMTKSPCIVFFGLLSLATSWITKYNGLFMNLSDPIFLLRLFPLNEAIIT